MLGPIDYIVVGFEGNNFDGSILDELSKSVENGVIRVIDLVFIVKDAEGNVVGGEVKDQPEELKVIVKALTGEESLPMFSEEDIEKTASKMEKNTAAAVLVIEHLWAKGLKKSILDAGGKLLDEGRIHPDIIAELIEEIQQKENN